MNQLALPLARRTDPQTSHAAADRVPSFKAKHEAAIYGAIFEAGERGATAKEIASVTDLTDVQVNRRLSAMGERRVIKRKVIEWIEVRGQMFARCVYEKRNGCAVWRVTR